MSDGKQTEPSRQKKVSADKIRKDPGLRMQEYLNGSTSAEETLFKINELLYSGEHENTRKNARAPVDLPVSFYIGGDRYESTLYTLSQKGAFIKHPDPPAQGTEIRIELEIGDGGGPIKATGEVLQSAAIDEAMKRASLSGMSVLFTRIGKDDRIRIDRLVRKQVKKMGKIPA